MAIQDNQNANAAYTNSKLMSRTVDTSTLGKVDFQNITESTDKDSGSVTVQGGVGIEKRLNVGGNILGANLSGTNTGNVTLDPAFGDSPNDQGATLTGQVLKLQPASETKPGGVSILSQVFGGIKQFALQAIFQAGLAIKDTGSAFKVIINAPTLAADYTITLPVDDGTADQILKTDGAGVLSWTTPAAGSSPLTTKGDLYTFDSANQRLPVGADGEILAADSGETTGLKWIASPVTIPPNRISYTTIGADTYTPTSGCTYAEVLMVGGGGGGAGSGSGAGGSGANGSNTVFDATGTPVTASAGNFGSYAGLGGQGGTVNVPAPYIDIASTMGGQGQGAAQGAIGAYMSGAIGGDAPFFGGGGRLSSISAGAGGSGQSFGGGGQGGSSGVSAANNTGSGGGSGGVCWFQVNAPTGTYDLTIGAGGAGGTAGASGFTGAAGIQGAIYITEYF